MFFTKKRIPELSPNFVLPISNNQQVHKTRLVLIGEMFCEDSDFVVSELVVGSGEQDICLQFRPLKLL